MTRLLPAFLEKEHSNKMSSITVVSKRRSQIGEGPIWDYRINRLIYVDIVEGVILRLDPETQEEEAYQLKGDFVSFVLPFESDPNKYIIGRNKQLCVLQWDTKTLTVCSETEFKLATRFNDAKCDNKGRLWAGTMALETSPGIFHKENGSLYSFCKESGLIKHCGGIRISNGLAWDKANKKMFYIDSLPKNLYVYDFDLKTGAISNKKILIDFNDDSKFGECGLPDGMTIDADDNLWVAFFNGSRIMCFDPNTCTVLKTLNFPCQKITSCAWGGPNYDILYVTSGRLDLSEQEELNQPNAGAIFKVTNLGVKGLPPIFYSE